MHLPLYPLLPSPCLSAKNSEHTFHMHSWLSLRNMERLQQLFCLTGLGHWWDGWLPLSRQHQRLFLRHSEDFYSFTGPPFCAPIHVFVFVFMHLLVQARSACSVCSLSLCVGGEPAGRVPSRNESTASVTAFSGSKGTLILLISMSTLTAWSDTDPPLSFQHWHPSLLAVG